MSALCAPWGLTPTQGSKSKMKTVADMVQEAWENSRKRRSAAEQAIVAAQPSRGQMPERMVPPAPEVAVTNLSTGLRALINRPFLQSQSYSQQQKRANRVGAHPDIIEFERTFVARMAKQGIPLFAHNMVRTPQEQLGMFIRGVSKKDGSKPYAHKGCAVDIVHGVKAWEIEPLSWSMLGHIGKEIAASKGIKIVWGGDWSDPNPDDPRDHGWDPAHWELANWRALYPHFPEWWESAPTAANPQAVKLRR